MEQVQQLALLTKRQAAERLGISERSVEREIREGRLRSLRIGKARRVDPRDLERYIEQQKERTR